MAQALHYPHTRAPAPGSTLELAPGVRWLRMPMPGSLDHINLYLLADGEGWAVVDTGLGDARTAEIWDALCERELGGAPIRRVLVTHMHPDHIGQAGALCERFRAPLLMTQAEYFHARAFAAPAATGSHWEAQRFYQRAGLGATGREAMRARAGGFGSSVTPLPLGYRRLCHGDALVIGDREWRVWVGAGHSPEHACLYCEALGVLIAGDQVLPVITSNVSVHPTEPEANPLATWLDSHARMRELPARTLVLPAHGLPFQGLHARLAQLIEHHESRMRVLEDACRRPRRAVDLLPVLFERELEGPQVMMALGECLAHLHLLLARGRMTRHVAEDGAWRFTTAS